MILIQSLHDIQRLFRRISKPLIGFSLQLCQIIGLDAQAIEEHFKSFLHAHPSLTAQQVRFMNLLQNYIAQHGSIIIEKLYDAPFSSISHEGIDGVFSPADVGDLVAVLKPFLRGETPPTSH